MKEEVIISVAASYLIILAFVIFNADKIDTIAAIIMFAFCDILSLVKEFKK